MSGLPITLVAASALALEFVALSINVTRMRAKTKIGLGAGGETSAPFGQEDKASPLLVAIRNQAHFAEYVPISLLLLGLLELAGADRQVLLGLAGVLVLARLMIPLGMGRPAPNIPRAGGNMLQWLMIVVAAVYGLWLALGS